MEIKELLKNYQLKQRDEKTPRSEREEVLKKFTDKLNADRVASGRKPLGGGFYAIKMAQSGVKTKSDLYWFYRYCEDAQNFSSTWWWSLNPKNAKQK